MGDVHTTALMISVEGGNYSPHEVRLNGHLIGYRPWSGARADEVAKEVADTLAELCGERLGWPQDDEDEEAL